MFRILEKSLQIMKELYWIWDLGYVGVCVKKSDVTPFVISNIFISNCHLITQFVLVTVTDHNYF